MVQIKGFEMVDEWSHRESIRRTAERKTWYKSNSTSTHMILIFQMISSQTDVLAPYQ